MARSLNRLSALFVRTAKDPGRYSDGGNLYLSISSNGGRRWVFLYRWNGKPTEMGLGSTRDVTLARAREKAAEARERLAEGVNPLEARAKFQVTPTFGDAADLLIASLEPSWRNPKHAAQWKMTLKQYAGPLRTKPVDKIGTEDLLHVLRPIWGSKPETASRVRGRIEAVLDAARAGGHRSSENPARWRGHLDKLLPARKVLSRGHHAAMPYTDVPAFVAVLRANPTTSNFALEFAILTAGRSGEIMGATWSEIDLHGKLWTLPARRMKGNREHQVPLSQRASEVLEQMKERNVDSDFVFPGAKGRSPLSVMAFTMAMRRTGAGEFTPHGFRSAFRDWCGDETSFPREVAEAALAHMVRDATERAYRRKTALERRRALMSAWASYLQSDASTEVVPLRIASKV